MKLFVICLVAILVQVSFSGADTDVWLDSLEALLASESSSDPIGNEDIFLDLILNYFKLSHRIPQSAPECVEMISQVIDKLVHRDFLNGSVSPPKYIDILKNAKNNEKLKDFVDKRWQEFRLEPVEEQQTSNNQYGRLIKDLDEIKSYIVLIERNFNKLEAGRGKKDEVVNNLKVIDIGISRINDRSTSLLLTKDDFKSVHEHYMQNIKERLTRQHSLNEEKINKLDEKMNSLRLDLSKLDQKVRSIMEKVSSLTSASITASSSSKPQNADILPQ